ncbi:MAG: ECF transporter S component [Patescibacteria group bacterium]|jgi:hypothetical protein
MDYLKEKTLELVNVHAAIQFLVLGSIATFLPFFIHVQFLTGPIVNAILIIALFLCGIRSAITLALIPSLMALAGGLLPAVLAPVVPFIMISNCILIFTIEFLYKKFEQAKSGFWIGLAAGAALKWVFLILSTGFISKLLLKQELAVKVVQMMSWPQLATAIAGGVIAFGILKPLKSIK